MIGIMGNDFFGKRMADAINKTMPAVFLYSSLMDATFKKKIKDVKIIHYVGSPTVSFHGVLNLIRLTFLHYFQEIKSFFWQIHLFV